MTNGKGVSLEPQARYRVLQHGSLGFFDAPSDAEALRIAAKRGLFGTVFLIDRGVDVYVGIASRSLTPGAT